MHHVIFAQAPSYKTAILIKKAALRVSDMRQYYIDPMTDAGFKEEEFIGFSLEYTAAGKCTVKQAKEYLDNLLPALDRLGVKNLLVCDAHYFKVLTGAKKADPHYGYILPCTVKGYEHLSVILSGNYQGVFYNPEVANKIVLSMKTLEGHLKGTHKDIGADIIKSEYYPSTLSEIEQALSRLHKYPQLTCDIEAFSLQFWEAGIATIGFAWDQHNGIAFPCDYTQIFDATGMVHPEAKDLDIGALYGFQRSNKSVKLLLRKFLEEYEGEIIWHNAGYDAKVLIYELWMEHPLDTEGLLKGLEIMTKRVHDTQIILYLATNSCAGNKLGLKDAAHEFAGNYAQEDIKDVRKISLPDLLRYNLIDCLSTWYVYNTKYPVMQADQQEDIYKRIFLPSLKVLLQIELTGLPLLRDQVQKTKKDLEAIRDGFIDRLFALPRIINFEKHIKMTQILLDNQQLVNKVRTLDDPMIQRIKFNPGSNQQLQELIYTQMGYPVIDKTDAKQPAVGAKTLKKLLARTKGPEDTEIFECLIGLSEVSIILSTFINAFETKVFPKADGRDYLHGNFKLGGTVSGRLSSSGPNLMNLPSTGSVYAKHTKSCFVPPPGWIIMGADFSSLEDRISALLTKDPNKLAVYIEGYDGHCFRAYYYFGDQMVGITDDVASINSIAKKFPELRQDSKAPTFLLTYGGTYHGLMNNVGLSEKAAKAIEENYHKMYKVSDDYVAGRIQEATVTGYVTVAFGLRVRTPILAKTILNNSKTPYEATAEARTAGNAMGQSYGMLNNRTGIEFQERTLASKHRLDILPIAHIHDASYYLVRDCVHVVKWFNDNLVECMQWQDLPEIQHPQVGLGGNASCFHPSWATEYELPNNATEAEIREACKKKDK